MWKVIELFFVNHANGIAAIANISIAFLTYQNIRESRRATIMAQEKKNVIDACKYAIQLNFLIEKCEEEFQKIHIVPKPFSSKNGEDEHYNIECAAKTISVQKKAQKMIDAIRSNNREEMNKNKEIIDKIREPIHNKVTELRTVSAFLPEDANKQIHFLQSYYKHLGGLNNFIAQSEGEIVGRIDKFRESQQKKLKEIGFSSSTEYFESLQKYFHENIKKVIADKKFSLHNLAKIWIPYEKFKTEKET